MLTPTDDQVEAANLYRKKPIVIEARYFDGTHHSADHLIEWMGNTGTYIFPKAGAHNGQLYVGTLEDGAEGEAKHVASKGDWIIKGIAGEFYPIKPEIFADSYEPAALTAAFSLGAPAIEWRCFHCGQVFTDRIAAETHFGKSADIDPACLSSVKKMREHVLASLSAERAP